MRSKKTIAIAAVVLLAALAALGVMLFRASSLFHRMDESQLYRLVAPYRAGETPWTTGPEHAFPEGSAEDLFLRGMDVFGGGDLDGARTLFNEALAASHSDPALPAYLHYYINECVYLQTGAGDYEAIRAAMEGAAAYPPLASDGSMLWDLVYTIAFSPDTDAQAIALMEDYLARVDGLEPAAWARLKNCVGMLEYNNEEYAVAIRHFYDVELAAEAEEDDSLRGELAFAKNYIANIYYVLENYEETVALYQEIIDSEDGSPDTAYSHYINIATAYLELGRVAEAEETAAELRGLLPQLDPEIAAEVEACLDNVQAQIHIAGGGYAQAEASLSAAEEYYRLNPSVVFPGGEYHTALTRCELLICQGELEEAQAALEELAQGGQAAYYGLEEDVYRHLTDVCRQTGQTEGLIRAYERLLELDEEKAATIQREYLEFSEYYRDVNRLEAHGASLYRVNAIAMLTAAIIFVVLVIVAVLSWLLRAKNLTDQLTGVYNRKVLTRINRRYRRSGTPAGFAVVMTDVDYFKRYNDAYGHPAGDQVLRQAAQVLTRSLRKQDTVIRYGGEEFLVLLSGVSPEIAQAVCERIRANLKGLAIPHGASEAADHVTMSMGMCHQTSPRQATLEQLISHADQCLYQSKEAGRDRVTSMTLG